MKRYLDYKNKNSKLDDLTEEELNSVKWTRYKIIVPSEEDKKESGYALHSTGTIYCGKNRPKAAC